MAVRIICALLATVFIAVLFQVRKENITVERCVGMPGQRMRPWRLVWAHSSLSSSPRSPWHPTVRSWRVSGKRPVTTFLISGLFPLVPGAGMYYTMLAIVHNDLSEALSTGISTLSTAGSDGIGDLVCLHAVPRHHLFPKDQKHRQMTGAFLMVRGETKAVSHADGAAWMRTHATGSPYGTA